MTGSETHGVLAKLAVMFPDSKVAVPPGGGGEAEQQGAILGPHPLMDILANELFLVHLLLY